MVDCHARADQFCGTQAPQLPADFLVRHHDLDFDDDSRELEGLAAGVAAKSRVVKKERALDSAWRSFEGLYSVHDLEAHPAQAEAVWRQMA